MFEPEQGRPEVAEVFRQFEEQYVAQYGAELARINPGGPDKHIALLAVG